MIGDMKHSRVMVIWLSDDVVNYIPNNISVSLRICSPNAENADQNSSEYGHFSHSAGIRHFQKIFLNSFGNLLMAYKPEFNLICITETWCSDR